MKIKGEIEDLKFLKSLNKRKKRMIIKNSKNISRSFSDVVLGS